MYVHVCTLTWMELPNGTQLVPCRTTSPLFIRIYYSTLPPLERWPLLPLVPLMPLSTAPLLRLRLLPSRRSLQTATMAQEAALRMPHAQHQLQPPRTIQLKQLLENHPRRTPPPSLPTPPAPDTRGIMCRITSCSLPGRSPRRRPLHLLLPMPRTVPLQTASPPSRRSSKGCARREDGRPIPSWCPTLAAR